MSCQQLKVVICRGWNSGRGWACVGRNVIFVPILAPAMKSFSSPARVFWKAAALRNTQRKISRKQRKLPSPESMLSHFVESSAGSSHRKVLFWASKSGLMFRCLNPVIRWASGQCSAFSSVKLLSISQLCVKVLLNKNAQNIYQVRTNFGIIYFWGNMVSNNCMIWNQRMWCPHHVKLQIQTLIVPKHLIPPC